MALPGFASQNLGGLTLEINYPPVPGAIRPQDFIETAAPEDIPSLYAQYILNLVIWAAGIITLGALIFGGVRYLTSTGKPEAITSAKNQISGAFFGLLLLLASFLVLKTLSPQFIVLKLPTPEPIPKVTKLPISPPPTGEFRSSINTETPFGKIIEEGVFEGTIPWEEGKRIPRIFNNAKITEELANKLKKQSEDLKGYSDQCTCRETKPENPCGRHKAGDKTWECGCGGCSATEPCTSDPCSPVRAEIQDTEKKNLEAIYSGTEITYTNKSKEEVTVTTNLIAEQIKTEEEVRLLKEQLARLERAEKFMLECYEWMDSLAVFLVNKDFFAFRGDILREIKFWNDILIKGDWATFYCPVSGTILGETEYTFLPESFEETELMPISEEAGVEESPACTTEAPVGEIIDRAKRTGYKLVERMETLIEWDKKLIDAVDKLQVLVSQCSSKRGCERRCTCFGCLCGHHHCSRGCKGWIYCCADSSPAYPGECKERDIDKNIPCPYSEIKKQLEEIQKIWQEMMYVINGKDKGGETPEERLEKTGILPIINEIVPKIFEDLNSKVREEMRYCVSEVTLEQEEAPDLINTLFTCGAAKRSVGPEGPGGNIIQECCFEEEPFQNCLKKCYLAIEYKEYKECLYNCIEGLPPNLDKCRHKLNFHCCQL